uniref:Coiled-coil domain containing 34 n=2 Tax=Scleropages formosus TaxID=113540 RepID=A0A8C9RAM7_SCLFO
MTTSTSTAVAPHNDYDNPGNFENSKRTPLRSEGEDKPDEPSISGSADCESAGESTSSLLSPIYHDSFEFESDPEEREEVASQGPESSSHAKEMTMPGEAEMKNSSSPGSNLSPWEEWVISKARQDRLRMEQKVREEASLKEAKMQQEKEQERRKITVEKKITEWLQMKRDQEKVEKQLRMNKALEEKHYKEQKKRETEEKAQKRYMEWLQKKNQEAMEKKQKEKEETVRRDLEARERKQRSEEEFKKWLMSVKHKPRPAANTSSSRRKMAGFYDNAYPAPSYCNPIPWKPIHNPLPHDVPKNSSRTSQRCRR